MAIVDRIQYKFRSDRGTYYRITIIDTDCPSLPIHFLSKILRLTMQLNFD